MKIKMVLGDITKSKSDAIVNAANKNLLMGSGVCGAIFYAAGPKELQAACDKLAPINTGDAVITPGFKLSKYVIHTAGPIYRGKEDAKYLRNSYYNSLSVAEKNNCKSISFPSISTGIYGYPVKDAAKVAINAILEYIDDNPNTTIEEISFYLFDEYTYSIYKNEYENR